MDDAEDGLGTGPGETDGLAPGWDAITAALERLYPGQEPCHYGPVRRCRLGGPDPIDGLSAYERLEPVPHWHVVTYGFSELSKRIATTRRKAATASS